MYNQFQNSNAGSNPDDNIPKLNIDQQLNSSREQQFYNSAHFYAEQFSPNNLQNVHNSLAMGPGDQNFHYYKFKPHNMEQVPIPSQGYIPGFTYSQGLDHNAAPFQPSVTTQRTNPSDVDRDPFPEITHQHPSKHTLQPFLKNMQSPLAEIRNRALENIKSKVDIDRITIDDIRNNEQLISLLLKNWFKIEQNFGNFENFDIKSLESNIAEVQKGLEFINWVVFKLENKSTSRNNDTIMTETPTENCQLESVNTLLGRTSNNYQTASSNLTKAEIDDFYITLNRLSAQTYFHRLKIDLKGFEEIIKNTEQLSINTIVLGQISSCLRYVTEMSNRVSNKDLHLIKLAADVDVNLVKKSNFSPQNRTIFDPFSINRQDQQTKMNSGFDSSGNSSNLRVLPTIGIAPINNIVHPDLHAIQDQQNMYTAQQLMQDETIYHLPFQDLSKIDHSILNTFYFELLKLSQEISAYRYKNKNFSNENDFKYEEKLKRKSKIYSIMKVTLKDVPVEVFLQRPVILMEFLKNIRDFPSLCGSSSNNDDLFNQFNASYLETSLSIIKSVNQHLIQRIRYYKLKHLQCPRDGLPFSTRYTAILKAHAKITGAKVISHLNDSRSISQSILQSSLNQSDPVSDCTGTNKILQSTFNQSQNSTYAINSTLYSSSILTSASLSNENLSSSNNKQNISSSQNQSSESPQMISNIGLDSSNHDVTQNATSQILQNENFNDNTEEMLKKLYNNQLSLPQYCAESLEILTKLLISSETEICKNIFTTLEPLVILFHQTFNHKIEKLWNLKGSRDLHGNVIKSEENRENLDNYVRNMVICSLENVGKAVCGHYPFMFKGGEEMELPANFIDESLRALGFLHLL